MESHLGLLIKKVTTLRITATGRWISQLVAVKTHSDFHPGFFQGEGKIYCYANFFVIQNFLLFSDQISGWAKVSGGQIASGGAPLLPVKESQTLSPRTCWMQNEFSRLKVLHLQMESHLGLLIKKVTTLRITVTGRWISQLVAMKTHSDFHPGFFQGGAKSIVMQIFLLCKIFYCFRTRFQDGQKSLGGKLCQGAPPAPRERKPDSFPSNMLVIG